MAYILVPNHTIWIARWILIVVKTARDDEAGTQHSSDIAWQLNMPSLGTTEDVSCKRSNMQRENVFYFIK